MRTDNFFYLIIYFIVTVVIAWIAFSLILMWARPALFNSSDSVNWGVTFWVSLVVILFAWLIMLILYWMIKLFTSSKSCKPKCVKPDPCAKPDPCDPCNKDLKMWNY